ncbi:MULTISPECIES: hypothetical protein [unclassified Agreia]|jgi:hypothetical protein|uniref:hypothetical protein n=1 Tax=unclassified Agreia TaxID=2641148 RepID=UPI0006F20E1F|nr:MULTISPECIES: hypothetical protein [unclassified Agreia]KQM59250.1 hypothetical protein ASE64_07570 [Agreia sp. Leaf210]KQO09899.1 hypothetical protein ASF06_06520 [Agreia sp. Leaf244]
MKTRTRAIAAVAVTLLTGVLVTGCASESSTTADPITEFEHTHGLGYDPDRGIVFAATHTGVWELPTSRLPSSFGSGSLISPPGNVPVLIENRQQDTMGFFVTDTGLILGSGHPDPADATAPANLGLIMSDSAAREWTTVSLAGEVDFHDIAAVPTPSGALRIYGYDATHARILTSDDGGSTWSDGAAVELRDMTIDPSNPDRTYVTTASGLQVSDDVARTFSPVPDAPALVLIDATDTGYVGIDVAGTVWHTTGAGWVQGGAIVGDPQALTFVGGSEPWLLVSDSRGVFATRDFGVSTVLLAKSP